MGVLRNRIGLREDRFFATVFLGSGLLVVAMLFTAAVATIRGGVGGLPDSAVVALIAFSAISAVPLRRFLQYGVAAGLPVV